MLTIQCRNDMFDEICKIMEPRVPFVMTEEGGYIDCFDKDWIFIAIDSNDDVWTLLLNKKDTQFLVGHQETKTLMQRNVGENEQYIFLRKDTTTNTYEVLWGASSFIKFNEVTE